MGTNRDAAVQIVSLLIPYLHAAEKLGRTFTDGKELAQLQADQARDSLVSAIEAALDGPKK